MQNRCCVHGSFFHNSSNANAHKLLTKMILRNFISLKVFIYYLHEKLTAVWKFTSVKLIEVKLTEWNLHRSDFHFAWTHMNTNNEVTSHRSEILPQSEISNRFETRSHVNVLLVVTVFRNFYRVAIMFVLKQPRSQHLFSIIMKKLAQNRRPHE